MGVPDSNQSIVFSLDPIFGVNLPTIDLVCLRTTSEFVESQLTLLFQSISTNNSTMSDVECDPQTDATPSVAIEDELHTAEQLQEVFEKYLFKVQSSKTASLYHAAMREMQIDMNATCHNEEMKAERKRHNEELNAERKRHNEEMERMKAKLERHTSKNGPRTSRRAKAATAKEALELINKAAGRGDCGYV